MALRTSTQVMSVILSVFGSGAVSGRLAIESARTLDTAATKASFKTARRRGRAVAQWSASDMRALQPAQSRRSAIVGGDAFEGVNLVAPYAGLAGPRAQAFQALRLSYRAAAVRNCERHFAAMAARG